MEIIYSLIAAGAAMIGALTVLVFHKWSERNSFLIINFTVGMMLTFAFTHLIPESLELNPTAMIYVLLGFLIMFFLQFFVLFHPCHDHECSKHMDAVSIAGLSLHSVIDGLMIAVSFEANSGIGILTTLAILFHKLPDGITISGILLHSGATKKKIFNFSFLTACLTPIGTIIGKFLFRDVSKSILGSFLGVTAGSFIFIAASDLIPEIHKSKNKATSLMLFVGVLVSLVVKHIIEH